MVDPVEEPAAVPEQVRAAAVARLASIAREFPPVYREGRWRRARRIAPGVYRPAGLYGPGLAEPTGDGDPSVRRPHGGTQRAPGPKSAALLSLAVAGGLSSHDLLDGIAGWDQLISWAYARQAEMVAEFARRRPGPYEPDEPSPRVSEFAADEIAARLRVSRRSADLKLGLALDLADRLPGTAAALEAGRIDVAKARAVAELTANLSPEAARAVETRVLHRAGEQTAPELRRSLLRAVAKVDPDAHRKRHRRARDERYLRVQPCGDGMAEMSGRLPAEDAMTVFGAVDELARCAAPDDPRSIDARRMDALVDLCRQGPIDNRLPAPRDSDLPAARSGNLPTEGPGGQPVRSAGGGNRASRRARTGHGRCGPQIRVTVAATTLLGLDGQPGELAGFGPIDADTARQIAADPDATWRRLLTDPVSGALLDYGNRVYRPPASLAWHVLARDQVCCFPGCRQPAERCDLDHGVPYPDGPTSATNLIPLCRHHHRAKTHGGWNWSREPDDRIVWTAPTSHQYQVPIPSTLDEPDYVCAELGASLRNPQEIIAQDRPPPDDPPPY